MFPIDALTDNDEEILKSYIHVYGKVAECAPISRVFREWNENKKTLFKALGRQLTVSKMISIPKSENTAYAQIRSIYNAYPIYHPNDIKIINSKDFLLEITHNEFIADVIYFWVNQKYSVMDLRIISRLFLHHNIFEGYISILGSSEPYHCESFKCTIKNGMKTIRTIQKVLKATNYPRMDLFEEWRNAVSLIQTKTLIPAKLVISIHPIDFITMSDNDCNWRSCMSWKGNGCYHGGTLEMLNSNVVAVAYLEAEKPFSLVLDEDHNYNLPNKSWRSLIYIHKDIILCGKSYPYEDLELSKIVLDNVRELVKKNLGWTYQFINQEYRDLDHLDGNFYVRDWFDVYHDFHRKQHHAIFFYTNGMYNDLIESHQTYLCCRNYVKHSLKICASGPATCICCGRRIIEEPRNEIFDYDDLGSTTVCSFCKTARRCVICGEIKYHIKYQTRYGNFCSDDCIKDTIVFPDLNNVMCGKENAQFGVNGKVVIFYDSYAENNEQFIENRLDDIKASFKNIDSIVSLNNWIREIKKKYPMLSIYKVSDTLSGYRYADIYPINSTIRTNINNYQLLVYPRDIHSYQRIEQRILALRHRATLLDFIKEVK